jgi:dienelactone hydrolase
MEVPVNRLKLQDDEKLLSPPIVAEPLYGCATAVKVIGFEAHALLTVQVDGTTVVNNAPGGFPLPDGAMLPLPNPLKPGQKVRARQKVGGRTSGWSAVVVARDFTADYPAGPPRPEIDPAPVYECGSRTGVNNLLIGSEVWITANGTEVGRVKGAKEHQGVNVAPDYKKGDQVVAHAQMCDDESPPSKTETAQQQPAPLPAPTFEPFYEGGEQLVLNALSNGARFTVSRNGSAIGTWSTWGGRTMIPVSPPFTSSDSFSATQQLCPSVGPSPPGTGTPLPCSALPAPAVGPIQDGDTVVTLLSFVPEARIRVYVNGVQVGDSGGPVVALTTAVHDGDTVAVRQSVGTCDGRTAQVVSVHCVDPPTGGDPAHFNLFPVGTTQYDGGKITLGGQQFSVKGTVYYPADSDGADTPFNARLAAVGKAPIVFMAHGNHDPSSPSHLGYDYFQTQLAQMGIVACSVFLNETNGTFLSIDNIHDRADLIIAGIAHMKSLSDGGDPIFGGKLDFGRVGTMGHSRGGDAVVAVLERITTPGVTIKAVIALAPTNIGASSGRPKGVAFMTILPASDGDVIDNNGAVFYDGATLAPLKVQLYVTSACHNFFNRQWLNNDNSGGLPTMARPDHERILSAYGCALYRAFLLGHATTGYLTYRVLPAGVLADNVQLAFAQDKAVTVDNYEDANGIGLNSLGQPNTQSGGVTAVEFPFAQVGGAFNTSFFGNTTGMVCRPTKKGGTFRWQLDKKYNLSSSEVWLRCAEVYTGSPIPPDPTGFQLGVEDANGVVGWVDCDEVGGLPRPFDRSAYDLAKPYHTDKSKTMLRTLRFNPACCKPTEGTLNVKQIVALLARLNRQDPVPLAFDDVQIIPV